MKGGASAAALLLLGLASAAPVHEPPSPIEALTRAREMVRAGSPAAAASVLDTWIQGNIRSARTGDLALVRLEAARAGLAAGNRDSVRVRLAELDASEAALSPAPVLLAQLRRERARLREGMGQLAQAERLLALAVDGLASNPAQAADAHNALGRLQMELDRPRDAVRAFTRSAGLLGCDAALAEACTAPLANLANAAARANDLPAARQPAERSQAAAGTSPRLRGVAALARAQVLLSDADPAAAETALADLVRLTATQDEALRGFGLYLLANSRYDRGLLPEALVAMQAANLAYRNALGDMNPARARVADGMATLEYELGDDTSAILFADQAEAIAKAAFGAGSIQAARFGISRALSDVRRGDLAGAERRAIAARAALAAAAEPNHFLEVGIHTVLGAVREAAGQDAAAAGEFAQARDVLDRIGLAGTPAIGFALLHLGQAQTRLGRLDVAQAALDRAVALYARLGTGATSWYAEAVNAAAQLAARRGDRRGELELGRRAYLALREQVARAGTGGPVRPGARGVLLDHAARMLAGSPERDDLEEAFAATQLAMASRTGDATRLAAARLSERDDDLGRLLKQRETVDERLRQSELLRRSAMLRGGPAAGAEERRLDTVLAELGARLQDLNRQLVDRFPRFGGFASARPALLHEVQAVLQTDEAVLVPAIREADALVWVVTRDAVRVAATPLSRAKAAALVGRLRAGLDLGRDRLAPFDVAAARELHTSLLGPFEAEIAGRRTLIVVPDGALQALPLSVLIDPATGDWLVRRFAVSVLPSAATLVARRETAAPPPRSQFLGVGDPQTGRVEVEGQDGAPELRRAVAGLPGLPETREELLRMASLFPPGQSRLLLGEEATKADISSAGIGRYGTLAFATHAAMAGELPGVPEPAIILTPGGEAVAPGLLLGSEITALDLDAELVILSACNTAASDGGPMSEGLSGLARAFLYAGARTLLVSHWAVDSRGTVPLTTAFLKELRGPRARSKAEALRDAMVALLDEPDAAMRHPSIWAAFVVVGE